MSTVFLVLAAVALVFVWLSACVWYGKALSGGRFFEAYWALECAGAVLDVLVNLLTTL